MVTLITYDEWWNYDSKGNKRYRLAVPVKMVSHGVDNDTLQVVVLQDAPLQYYISNGAVFNRDTGEWEI